MSKVFATLNSRNKNKNTTKNILHVFQVRKNLLKEFLIKHRSKGWKVVGAERVAGSMNVLDAEFDKKTILLLG